MDATRSVSPRRVLSAVATAAAGLAGALLLAACGGQQVPASPSAGGVRELTQLDYGPFQLDNVAVGETVSIEVDVEQPRLFLTVCSGSAEAPARVEVEFLDAEGQPVPGGDGAAVYRWDYDPAVDEEDPQGCNVGLDSIGIEEAYPTATAIRITDIVGAPGMTATVTVF